MELLQGEKERIARQYQKKMRKLDEALEKTSEIISKTTHYTAIVSLSELKDKVFYRGVSRILEQPEFRNLENVRLLLEIMEDRGRLMNIINRQLNNKVQVYIGSELGCPEMSSYSLVVSSYKFKNEPLGRLAVLGPIRMEYNHAIPALQYISGVLSDALDDF